MPAFNSARFISRAIDSVLAQDGPHLRELIIVDDCSSDDTLEFVRSRYGEDKRIKLLSTARNSGPGAARNLAISAAAGEWIALIDADDAWASDRLSRLLEADSEGTDLIFDNMIAYDQQADAETGVIFPALPHSISLVEMAAEEAPGSKFNYGYLQPLIRKAFLKQSGITYSDMRVGEDLLFNLELMAAGAKSRTIASACYLYTTPIGQRSRRPSPFSCSVPDAPLVAGKLDDLVSRYRDRLGAPEIEAISRRAARLRELAPLYRLYESWTRGRYLSFAWQCAADRAARRALLKKFRSKMGSGPR